MLGFSYMPKIPLVLGIIVILIAVIGFSVFRSPSHTPTLGTPSGETVPPASDRAAADTGDAALPAAGAPVVVTLTDKGFSPERVTVTAGESVTFVNQSAGGMWVASDPHPTHDGYSGTSGAAHCPDIDGVAFDECTVGDHYTFTFDKTGSWGYHNHVATREHGTVVVK